MADHVDSEDDCGSDFDSISDMSSLGSLADLYAETAAEAKPSEKEVLKKRRQSVKRRSVLKTGSGAEEGGSRRRSVAKAKSRTAEGAVSNLSGGVTDDQQRNENRITKRLELKGLNDRILGVDEDLFGAEDGKAAEPDRSPHTHQSLAGASVPAVTPSRQTSSSMVVGPTVGSASVPASPLRPRSPKEGGQAQSQPASRAPSPKVNLFGSSRVSPVPPEVTAQPTASGSSTVNNSQKEQLGTAIGIADKTNPSPDMTEGSSPISSPRGSFTSSGGKAVALPSAVSERRKAAAAARAAKMANRGTVDGALSSKALAEAGANPGSAVAVKDVPSSSQRLAAATIAKVSAATAGAEKPSEVQPFVKVKSRRRIARGDSSGSSDDGSSDESEEYSSSGSEEDDDRRGSRSKKRRKDRGREKEREREKEKQRQKDKEKEKEKEKEKRAKEKEKEKEIEREKERDNKDKSGETRRTEKTPVPEAPLSRTNSTASRSSPAPGLATAGVARSFGRRVKEPFHRMIKSTTYLNAIRMAHGEQPRVLCASADSTVQIYNITDGAQQSSLVGHTDRVISLAVSNPFMYADKTGGTAKATLKTLVASGSRDEQLRIWDMDSGRCLHSIHAHKSPIWAVAIAVRPNGDVIVVTTSGDGGMRSWNGKTGKRINTFKGHTDKILSVFIMNPLGDTPLVLSGGSDKKIRVWELLTSAHIRMLEGHSDEINCVTAATYSGISSLTPISQAGDGPRHGEVPGLDANKSAVIVSCSKDQSVRVWDFRTGHLLYELSGHTACVYEVAILRARESPLAAGNKAAIPPGTPIIVSCSEDATVKFWNLVTGKLVKSLKWHSVSVRGIDAGSVVLPGGDPNGTPLIASCGWDKTIQFHELGEALYAKSASLCSIM